MPTLIKKLMADVTSIGHIADLGETVADPKAGFVHGSLSAAVCPSNDGRLRGSAMCAMRIIA
jgi:hypothetical protein